MVHFVISSLSPTDAGKIYYDAREPIPLEYGNTLA